MSKKKETKQRAAPPELSWKVVIPRKVYDTIFHVAECAAPDEVQLLGEVTYDNGDFLLHGVHLLHQRVSGASASIDSAALAKFISAHPHPERIRGWVHSHVKMGLFWSGTDEATIARFVRRGWCLSIVVDLQRNGSVLARIDMDLKGVHETLAAATSVPQSFSVLRILPTRAVFDNVPCEITGVLTENEKEFYKKEVEDKVESHDEVPVLGRNGKKVVYEVVEEEETTTWTCNGCIYDNANKVCEKNIERGQERCISNCKYFYPAVESHA